MSFLEDLSAEFLHLEDRKTVVKERRKDSAKDELEGQTVEL